MARTQIIASYQSFPMGIWHPINLLEKTIMNSDMRSAIVPEAISQPRCIDLGVGMSGHNAMSQFETIPPRKAKPNKSTSNVMRPSHISGKSRVTDKDDHKRNEMAM